jgi:hypothetical protein
MNTTNKPTTLFWIIGVLALLWNIMGVSAYLGQAYMTDEILTNLTDAEQNYYNNLPAWVTAAFAIAAFAGAFACIAFLFKKKWATLLFQISLLGVLAQFIYNFFIQKYVELTGDKMIMPFIVILISIFLVWYSKKSESNGYLS